MDTQNNLTTCDQEQIQFFSKIQQNGVLYVVSYDDFIIHQVSDNCFIQTGKYSSSVVEQSIEKFYGQELTRKLSSLSSEFNTTPTLHTYKFLHEEIDYFCVIHLEQEYIILEMSDLSIEKKFFDIDCEDIILQATKHCETELSFEELTSAIVQSIKSISGFDRVLLYKFDPKTYDGKVIAEAKEENDVSFLDHHFPASDIPVQARTLYTKNRFRIIGDVNETNPSLFPSINPITLKTLDMTNCYLRSVSPIHIEYLKNMGVAASMSLSIVVEDKLWGLIACHHSKPKKIPLSLYKTYYLLSNIFSAQIHQKEIFVNYAKMSQLQYGMEIFIANLVPNQESHFFDVVFQAFPQFSQIVSFDAFGLFIGDHLYGCSQKDFSKKQLVDLYNVAYTNLDQGIFATSNLIKFLPNLLDQEQIVGGIAMLQIGIKNPFYLLLIRYEQVKFVQWAGEPTKKIEYKDGQIVINPRASFETWKETVRGTSHEFCDIEITLCKLLQKKLYNTFLLFQAYEEKQAIEKEKKIFENQKIDSIVEVINNIAHQWRQPLSIITTIASTMQLQKEMGLPIDYKYMDQVVEQSVYLSHTIDDFRYYFTQTSQSDTFHLSKVIEVALSLTSPIMEQHLIKTILKIDADIELCGGQNEVIQGIINILNNSKDALEDKTYTKLIFVETKKIKDRCVLEILDNGGGIDESLIPRIFEPYITSKHQSIGTGLGLYIVHRIFTKHHNATINVENKCFNYEGIEYKGASFSIIFENE